MDADDWGGSTVGMTEASTAGAQARWLVVVGDTRTPLGDGITLGSAASADAVVADETVSRRHARLVPRGARVRIVDEGSRNGTWVGAVRVQDAEVEPPCAVRLGRVEVRIEAAAGGRATPPIGAVRRFGAFSTVTPTVARFLDGLKKVAQTEATVLLEGESGTGKELLAEAIHDESPRRDGPFVVVDCGALAPALVEAELFGHERGAFTGADRARPGSFVQARRGTVFLDEIGELPPNLQTRLLGVLERRQVKPLGGVAIAVDVRVVAATHRNLEREVEEGRFRLDLFHRLAVVHRRIPPLRERPADVLHLAERFAAECSGAAGLIDDDARRLLASRELRGNARELKNLIERLALFGRDEVASTPRPVGAATGAGAPADSMRAIAGAGLPWAEARERVLERFTTMYVEDMLQRHDGNVTAAAATAGMARRHFHRLKRGD
jgi:DNA-binding NtrC family response regulator